MGRVFFSYVEPTFLTWSYQIFWCLKSTFILSLSAGESQVSLLARMLGYCSFSLFLVSTFTLATSSRESLFQKALIWDLGDDSWLYY